MYEFIELELNMNFKGSKSLRPSNSDDGFKYITFLHAMSCRYPSLRQACAAWNLKYLIEQIKFSKKGGNKGYGMQVYKHVPRWVFLRNFFKKGILFQRCIFLRSSCSEKFIMIQILVKFSYIIYVHDRFSWLKDKW